MVAMQVPVPLVSSGIARVKMSDLIASEGVPCNSYQLSVSMLTQSLSQNSAVILQLAPHDAALLQACLHSAPLYFNHKSNSMEEGMEEQEQMMGMEWCRTSGYYADPQLSQETFDYRPGLTLLDPSHLSPSALPHAFSILAKAARCVLDALTFSLNLRTCSFHHLLDNLPLRNHEVSSSVLSLCCHSRPSFLARPHHPHTQLSPLHYEHQLDKTLLTLIKPDSPGLHIKDLNGCWLLADTNLGPHDVLVYPGLSLYQETAGYVMPALHRTDVPFENNLHGRCSLAFKLMPKSIATLSSTEMQAAGYGVEPRFQNAIPVSDFMQRSHPVDQLFSRNAAQIMLPDGQAASLKASLKKKRETSSSQKSLPPSKRLRLEAQRVLKEKVMEIAEKKGLKMKFCRLGPCEDHIRTSDGPCNNIRVALGWPPNVPFVHPHDLPNKAKIAFLEAYEPGWSESRQDVD
ncbi:2-oxoglutarate (2OG) and Fe(II)-dependent oxygenase superfamily protein [Rhynchospora pubera]|uniref:2-oxoglutarate (2OG) and Fe(II)-dependent oxygenase superfamily protein n=1 Tax=Rhynchospora pubera TaxID=906938 RepID=A0AAV8C396_9POAL|nr:2-oxoglutarate (2OG) and Fe(II)-dependent oxygenase superfamily protein [Rhynchospora pubera]